VLSGWQINGILALSDGTPVSILTGFNRGSNPRPKSDTLRCGNRIQEHCGECFW
jgi:hypothetical protein